MTTSVEKPQPVTFLKIISFLLDVCTVQQSWSAQKISLSFCCGWDLQLYLTELPPAPYIHPSWTSMSRGLATELICIHRQLVKLWTEEYLNFDITYLLSFCPVACKLTNVPSYLLNIKYAWCNPVPMAHLLEVVQSMSVTIWKFEPIQVLQWASVIIRGHFGNLI